MSDALAVLALDYECSRIGRSLLIHADCMDWLRRIPEGALHGIVTDPPYGVKEYDYDQLKKRREGNGGIWRIPPSFDGHERQPLPRFTALDRKERRRLHDFFLDWSRLVTRVLRPGAHVFIATNAFIAPMLYQALIAGGLEFRGQVVRLVRTLRGGDRPKNAEREFPQVSSMPRGCYEPWGILRKPMPPRMKLSECLRTFQTGGLRRTRNGKPFEDVISSERTPKREKEIAPHPSLKPQSFLRQIVYACLPLGEGIIADPFMGSGATIAAAESLGLSAVGVERFRDYYDMAVRVVPQLAAIHSEIQALDPQQRLFT